MPACLMPLSRAEHETAVAAPRSLNASGDRGSYTGDRREWARRDREIGRSFRLEGREELT